MSLVLIGKLRALSRKTPRFLHDDLDPVPQRNRHEGRRLNHIPHQRMSLNCLLPLRIRTSPPRPTSRLKSLRPVPRSSPLEHDAYIGRQHLAFISPPRTRTQVVFADTSALEDPDFNRHKAYLAKENVERSSACRSGQVITLLTLEHTTPINNNNSSLLLEH